MSAPFVVSIPHRLGKDEAVRRLKAGLGNASSNYAHVFAVEEEIWTGEHLQFRVRALGQLASGTIDVAEVRHVASIFAVAAGQNRRRDPATRSQGRHAVVGKEVIDSPISLMPA